jgi:hypothetical protein
MKNKYTFRTLFAALIFTFISSQTFSQLVVTAGGTPQNIVNAFVGSGLTVSNINLNCFSDSTGAAYGTFNGSSSNIGLPNGVILTTGSAAVAVGPNVGNSSGVDRLISAADPQLTAIEPLATHDLCVLEFDIVPHCSSLQLRFVFGSEEYPEFVNSGYNDVFGFFVTGPDGNCVPGFYNNTNVAVLPSGAPVSIDNINNGNAQCPGPLPGPCVNCAYYVDNCGGATVEYDGFTTAIIVNLTVCPCATYHWKFAIADAGDGVYDSGILIDYLSCAAPFSYNVSTQNASCSCNGSATVNVTTGTPPYTYLWSNNATTQTVTGLCTGTYTVSVSDAASCNLPVMQTFTINSSSTAINVSTTHNNISCHGGNNGSASATVTTGNPPFTYSWNTTPAQTTATANNLSAGTYTVTVTDSVGCIGTASATITEPTALAIAFNNFSHTTCGNANGSISPAYSGGTGQYTYSWSTTPAQTTAAVSNLAAGTYVVTVTDANSCTASASFTINPSAPPVIITTPNASICAGGSTLIGASGASTYVWSPSSSLSSSTGSSVSANPALTTTYQVTGTDANGCTASASITVTVNPLPLVVSPANPEYCVGGSAVLTLSGAQSYHWSPQTGLSNPNSSDSSQVTTSIQTTTVYTVTGFSAEGCSATISFTVTVDPAPVAVITPNGPTSFCDGGSVTLTASGGNSFLWSNNSTSSSIAVNASGTFTVTVTDNNTCSGSASQTITVHPLPVAVISPAGPVLICSNSPAILSANTGNGFVYQWYQNNTLISGEVNSTLTVTSTGSYTVHITDANGCTATSIPVQVNEGVGPVVSISSSPGIGCLLNTIYVGYGPQSITLTAVSSTAVSYLWSTGATTQSISITTTDTYSVTAYDANGCPSVNTPESQIHIEVIDIRCGQGKKKIILCHVPPGNLSNPQTICIAPSAIPHHLEHHDHDCLGPCSLYYPRMDSPTMDDETKVMVYPNPFDNTFIVAVESVNGEQAVLNMYDVTGRIILSNYKIIDMAELGADLNSGVYSVEIVIGDRREMYKIVKL